MTDPGRKPPRPQHVFVVERTEPVSPHLVRVHLGGPAFGAFVDGADPARLASTDKYVKLLIARPELGLVPPYDLDDLRERLAREDLPVRRTYTVRSVDHAARTIAIDFVVHGDEGIAGPWAASARPGDLLALSGPGGGYRPESGSWHLFLVDDSALPALAAAVEALEPDARGLVLAEVDGPDDELDLDAPAGLEVRWLHRRGLQSRAHGAPAVGATSAAEAGTLLRDAVAALPRPSQGDTVSVFAHGERSAIKAIRRVLQDEWGIDKRDMSLSAYWALGRAEDRFQAEKREPVGAIFPEGS